MQTYTNETLTACLDDNHIRIYELTRLIPNCSYDQGNCFDKKSKLDADIESVTNALESNSESYIEISTYLDKKLEIF